jgi:hypothetical protein
VISLTAVQMANFATDPGVGWHLLSGEITLKAEAVPHFDPFLASAVPRRWISDQWLADVGLFALFAAGSWPLIYGALGALYLATYFLILYPLTVRLTGAPILAAATCFLAFKVGQLHFILRPVVCGFFCFALTAALMWRGTIPRPGEPTVPASRRVPLILLPLLFAVWANLHPSFVLGLVFLALHPIGLAIDTVCQRIFRRGTPPTGSIGASILLLIAAAAATCLNPNGLELHRSIVLLGRDPFFMNYHQEWLPPDPLVGVGLTLTLTTAVLCGAFLTEQRPRTWGAFELLSALVFGWLAFSSIRVIPFFGIVVAVPLARSLANRTLIAATTTGLRGMLRDAWRAISRRELGGPRGVVVTIILCLGLVSDPLIRGAVFMYPGPFGPSPDRFPAKAVAALAEYAAPERRVIAVAPPQWGGFITWRGDPFIRPIIDDRNTLLGAPFYRQFLGAFVPGGAWSDYLSRSGATHLVWPTTDPLVAAVRADGRYREAYTDEVATVFVVPPNDGPTP